MAGPSLLASGKEILLENHACYQCLVENERFCTYEGTSKCCPLNDTSVICQAGFCSTPYKGSSKESEDLSYNHTHEQDSTYDDYMNLFLCSSNQSNPCEDQTANLTLPSIGYLINSQIYKANSDYCFWRISLTKFDYQEIRFKVRQLNYTNDYFSYFWYTQSQIDPITRVIGTFQLNDSSPNNQENSFMMENEMELFVVLIKDKNVTDEQYISISHATLQISLSDEYDYSQDIPEEESVSTSAIILGVVIGGSITGACILFMVCLIYKQCKEKEQPALAEEDEDEEKPMNEEEKIRRREIEREVEVHINNQIEEIHVREQIKRALSLREEENKQGPEEQSQNQQQNQMMRNSKTRKEKRGEHLGPNGTSLTRGHLNEVSENVSKRPQSGSSEHMSSKSEFMSQGVIIQSKPGLSLNKHKTVQDKPWNKEKDTPGENGGIEEEQKESEPKNAAQIKEAGSDEEEEKMSDKKYIAPENEGDMEVPEIQVKQNELFSEDQNKQQSHQSSQSQLSSQQPHFEEVDLGQDQIEREKLESLPKESETKGEPGLEKKESDKLSLFKEPEEQKAVPVEVMPVADNIDFEVMTHNNKRSKKKKKKGKAKGNESEIKDVFYIKKEENDEDDNFDYKGIQKMEDIE